MAKTRVLLLSLIPARKAGDGYEVDNRWAKDVNAQAERQAVTLLCPVEQLSAGDFGLLDRSISVEDLNKANLAALAAAHDAIQLPGNFGWRASRKARTLQRLAVKAGKPVFVGISSHRARTAWINRKKGALGAAKALVRYVDIRLTQRAMARKATGVFVVGAGIERLARPNRNVHVSVASWVNEEDIYERQGRRKVPLRLCCASRLEAMKGVSLGVAAAAQVGAVLPVRFDIVGEGPEREDLEALVDRAGLRPVTRFLGTLSYPEEFLAYLRTVDLVLLTNLNDEQPRLIFDAISQGCIPICPDAKPYRALDIDERLLYQRGRAEALSTAIGRVAMLEPDEIASVEASLRNLARQSTMTEMHRLRAEWMATT